MSKTKKSQVTSLDQKFWQNFAKNYWQKKPLALKSVQHSLNEVSAEEIFDLLVLYANRCRKLNDPEGFKFFIDGYKAGPEDVLQVLPEKSDKSLQGYHNRMKSLFSDYCLVCDELLTVNMKKQHLLTQFTNELYKHVGFPNRFAEIGLYLGNYKKTPFGVHVDACGVFSFPVVGTKKFRIWTPEFVQANPKLDRAFRYDKYKKDSLLLEASPGDMTYWPSSAWHIAESDGSFSATWSLGVWVDRPLSEIITSPIIEALEGKNLSVLKSTSVDFEKLHANSGEVTDLPSAYQKSIEAIKQLTTKELEEVFLKSWMQHVSLQGFKNIPKQTEQIKPNSKIKLSNPTALILWQESKIEKNKIYASFGGITITLKTNSSLFKLIQELNKGSECRLDKYLKSKVTDFKLFEKLAVAGAFRLV